MAKVISSTTINTKSKRLLPVGVNETQDSKEELGGLAETKPLIKNETTEEVMDINYIQQLIKERDEAFIRADSAEKELSLITTTVETAEKEGYEAGLEKVDQIIIERLVDEKKAFEDLLLSIADSKAILLEQLEDVIVEIAFTATSKMLGKLNTNKQLLLAYVKEAIQQIPESDEITIYLSPQDLKRLDLGKTNLNASKNILVRSDDKIKLGGCRIESNSGGLDARLEVQMEELKKTILRNYSAENILDTPK